MKAKIEKFGNTAVILIPPTLLRLLKFSIDQKVYAEVINGKLVVTPFPKSRNSLFKLIARCNPNKAAPTNLK